MSASGLFKVMVAGYLHHDLLLLTYHGRGHFKGLVRPGKMKNLLEDKDLPTTQSALYNPRIAFYCFEANEELHS